MKSIHDGLPDPTYIVEDIQRDPIWRLAFEMSELDNDNAPIGWGQYIELARLMTHKYEIREKRK